MVFYLIKSIFIGILFIDFLDRKFPNQLKEFCIKITYNCIYLYSKLQMYFYKLNKTLNKFIETNPILLKFREKLDLFLKPVSFTNTVYVKYGRLCQLIDLHNEIPDFSIVSWLSDNKNYINKQIIYDMSKKFTMSEESDIKFVLIKIKVGDGEERIINLKTPIFNYYLVGNKITKEFLIFYLKYYLEINDHINNTDKISVNIIDHNINVIDIDFTDKNESIILEKNGYQLLNTNHNDEK
jgi:hypothetical protein